VLLATAPSGFWLSGIRYFLEVRPLAHWRASAHFFSEISRLRLARDRGMGLWLPACSAAALAYSSAFSLPVTPLCAGHYRISTTIPGLALRSVASPSVGHGVFVYRPRWVTETHLVLPKSILQSIDLML